MAVKYFRFDKVAKEEQITVEFLSRRRSASESGWVERFFEDWPWRCVGAVTFFKEMDGSPLYHRCKQNVTAGSDFCYAHRHNDTVSRLKMGWGHWRYKTKAAWRALRA